MDEIAAPYLPRRPAHLARAQLRGLDLAVHVWPTAGTARGTPAFLLHGFMDSGATWAFMVDALQAARPLYAPDWRGFGASAWAHGGYWFEDYYADLDALLDHFNPGSAVDLVGHSMGGNIALTYAGLRPERIRRVISLEGFGLPDAPAQGAPERLREWLRQTRAPAAAAEFPDVPTLARVLQRKNPRLRHDRALFVAAAWSVPLADGRIRLVADPAHKRVNPHLFRRAESQACWSQVRAPVLYVLGEESLLRERMQGAAEAAVMRACVPHLEAQVVESAGHMLHHDQPAAVAALVDEFLSR